jgi:hypothetical protein
MGLCFPNSLPYIKEKNTMKSQYQFEIESRIVGLIEEGLQTEYKLLQKITEEKWDDADSFQSACEDLQEELGVLLLIKECLC